MLLRILILSEGSASTSDHRGGGDPGRGIQRGGRAAAIPLPLPRCPQPRPGRSPGTPLQASFEGFDPTAPPRRGLCGPAPAFPIKPPGERLRHPSRGPGGARPPGAPGWGSGPRPPPGAVEEVRASTPSHLTPPLRRWRPLINKKKGEERDGTRSTGLRRGWGRGPGEGGGVGGATRRLRAGTASR